MNARLLGDIHVASAAQDGDRVAVADEHRRLSYGELADRVNRLSGAFGSTALAAGDRAIVLVGNHVAFVEAHLSVLGAGAVSVPLSPAITRDQLQFYLKDTGATMIVADGTSTDLVTDLASPSLKAVYVTGEPGPGQISLEDAAATATPRERAARRETDLATILYTTGTSGTPKGVMLSHSNALSALQNTLDFVRPDHERELIVLPLSHSFGLGQLYSALATGGTVFLRSGLVRLKQVLQVLREERITAFASTPAGYHFLFDRAGERFAEAATTLRYTVINSAALPPSTAAKIAASFPRTRLIVYYGLTEASRSTFADLSTEDPSVHTTVGRAASQCEVSVVDGEIVVRGKTVALGYWNRPDETAQSFRNDGLHTGDLGQIDASGRLFLKGRLKEIVNVGGLKVAPAEVEQVLGRHPSVADCAVCGVSDPMSGERVAALVVPANAAAWNSDEAEAYCAAQLEAFMVPKLWVTTRVIPRTDTGKPLRDDIRRSVAASLLEC